MPSLLLLQAPIFHGHAFTLHVEMEKPVEIETCRKALAGEHVTITGLAEEPPSNVNAAGQGEFCYRFSRIRILPTGFGYGRRRTISESPRPLRWNARKIWPRPVPKGRFNDLEGRCAVCGAVAR